MTKNLITFIIISIWVVASNDAKASGSTFSPKQVQAVKGIIKDYLQSNPEVVAQAIQELQKRHQKEVAENAKKTIQKNQQEIFANSKDEILGNPKGSKQWVIFADPYCGHCRQFSEILDQAIKKVPDLKVIIKDLPIFGEPSIEAIQALKAASQQGKYKEMLAILHQQKSPLSLEQLKELAQGIKGMNIKRFAQDLHNKELGEVLKKTVELAQKLGINGTPISIWGEQMVGGVIPLDDLVNLVNGNIAKVPETNTDTE